MISHGTLQHRHIDRPVRAGGPDLFAEVPNGGSRITSPPQSRNGWHARIVPPGNRALINQLLQLALARDRVAGIEPGKLDLARLFGTGKCAMNQSYSGR